MGPEQMEAGSDNGGLEQIGTWENEYLGIWVCGEMGIWGKYIFGGIGHRGKWALVQIGPKANGHLGKRGTLSARCSFSPNVYKWALGQMGTWGKWTFGKKGYPKCPMSICPGAHLPQILICPKYPIV